MPRVALTAEQREAYRKKDRMTALSEGLRIHKVLLGLTYEQMAKKAGMDVRCLRKIINGDDAYITVNSAMELMDMAGLGKVNNAKKD